MDGVAKLRAALPVSDMKLPPRAAVSLRRVSSNKTIQRTRQRRGPVNTDVIWHEQRKPPKKTLSKPSSK